MSTNRIDTSVPKKKRGVIPLSNRMRIVLLCAGVLLVLLPAAWLVFLLMPKTATETDTLYTCRVEADSSYRVFLNQNSLYDEQWLPEKTVYSEALTDYIEVQFRASFWGSEASSVTGTCQISIVLEGSQGTVESRPMIYYKEFPLKTITLAPNDSGSASIEELLDIRMQPYFDYANQADSLLQTNLSKRCTLTFTGRFSAATPYGDKSQDFTYQLPLHIGTGSSLYQITKPEPFSSSDIVTRYRDVQLPVERVSVIIACTGLTAGILLLIFTAFLTRLPNPDERRQISGSSHSTAVRRYLGCRSACIEDPR